MGYQSAHSVWSLAREQWGVVSRRQLLELGYGPQAIKRRVANGRLHQARRGVYAVGRPELSRYGGWMAIVLGCAAASDDWDCQCLDERIHHLMAHWPDVKLHWYGKGQRRGRKLGHVTALGEDLTEVRARAVAAARYLADGVVDPAFAFDDDH